MASTTVFVKRPGSQVDEAIDSSTLADHLANGWVLSRWPDDDVCTGNGAQLTRAGVIFVSLLAKEHAGTFAKAMGLASDGVLG